MNPYIEMFQNALSEYRTDLEKLQQSRKPLDGIFGTGSSMKSDACHDRFDNRVQEILSQTVMDKAPTDAIGEAVSYVLSAAMPSQNMNNVDWFLIAIQRHCLPLVDHLTAEAAAVIAEHYEKLWPRRFRLPMQIELLKALKARANQ